MHTVSPSQLSTADRCLRRWWWQSVKGFKSPATASTQFGSDVHAAIEHRIANNNWPREVDCDVLRCAVAAYDAFVAAEAHPKSGFGDLVEEPWAIEADTYQIGRAHV